MSSRVAAPLLLLALAVAACRDLTDPGEQNDARTQTAELTLRHPDGSLATVAVLRIYQDLGELGIVELPKPDLRTGTTVQSRRFPIPGPGLYDLWINPANNAWPMFSARDVELPATTEIVPPLTRLQGTVDLGASIPVEQLTSPDIHFIHESVAPNGSVISRNDWVSGSVGPDLAFGAWLIEDAYAANFEFRLDGAFHELRSLIAEDFPGPLLESLSWPLLPLDLDFRIGGLAAVGSAFDLDLDLENPGESRSLARLNADFDGAPIRLWALPGLHSIEVFSEEGRFVPRKLWVEVPAAEAVVVELGEFEVGIRCTDADGLAVAELPVSVARPDGDSLRAVTDEFGEIHFNAQAGRHLLWVSSQRYPDFSVDGDLLHEVRLQP